MRNILTQRPLPARKGGSSVLWTLTQVGECFSSWRWSWGAGRGALAEGQGSFSYTYLQFGLSCLLNGRTLV